MHVAENMVGAVAVIARAAGAVTELQLGMIRIGSAADAALMMIAPLRLLLHMALGFLGTAAILLCLRRMAIALPLHTALEVGGEEVQRSKYYVRRYAHGLVRAGRTEDALKALKEAYTNSLEYYEQEAEIYHKLADKENVRRVMKQWYEELFSIKNQDMSNEKAEYYDSLAWTEMICGDVKRAISCFEKEIQFKKVNEKEPDNTGLYCDLIFGALLSGDDKIAMVYSKRLIDLLEKKRSEGENLYYEMDKIALQKEFLSKYFTATKEELEEILERDAKTNICYFCTEPLCKEIEALKVLHLLRVGKTEEAFAKVEEVLKKNPCDEWMHTIKNVCKDGIKVVPYEVNGQKKELIQAGESAIYAYFRNADAKTEEKKDSIVKRLFTSIFKG